MKIWMKWQNYASVVMIKTKVVSSDIDICDRRHVMAFYFIHPVFFKPAKLGNSSALCV